MMKKILKEIKIKQDIPKRMKIIEGREQNTKRRRQYDKREDKATEYKISVV